MSTSNQGLPTGLWEAFISSLFKSGSVSVPGDFHGRCSVIDELLDDDVTGIVSTLVNYAINSASETKFQIECADETLENLLTLWLERINIQIDGVPTGLQELSREYYKERWAGSSLILLKYSKWETISIGNVSIKVPTILIFMNGASIYIKRSNAKNFKLGSDRYFLSETMKESTEIPVGLGKAIIQKPFDRWHIQYPTPYLIKQGVYRNWKALKLLQAKADEVIAKVLPYLLVLEKGDKDLFAKEGIGAGENDLQTAVDKFKVWYERYKNEGAKLPLAGFPFDQKLTHIIPELNKILSEELYRQGNRAILSGLGFIDVIQGVSSTRKESVLNPKPFIAEVTAGVEGFKAILLDVINSIIIENKYDHRKLFSNNNPLRVVSSPLKINIEQIIDQLRSAYVYGTITIHTYHEILGIDHEQEVERMQKEQDNNLRELFYPHLIQNQEAQPDNVKPAPITKKQVEKDNEKKEMKTEEANEFEIAPYDKSNPPTFLKKYPVGAQEVFIEVFNENYPKGEDYAFPVAWTALKRWMKKNGYKKVNDKWVKSDVEETVNE